LGIKKINNNNSLIKNKNKIRIPLRNEHVKGNENKNKNENLIYKILKRWWYAIGEWPPKNFDPQ
jgi:hypothetical protein